MKFRYIFGLVSRSLFVSILSRTLDVWGSYLNQGFRREGIAKNNFLQKPFFMDFGIDICYFLEALGAVFMIIVDLETGLSIDEFSRWICIQNSWGVGGTSHTFSGL